MGRFAKSYRLSPQAWGSGRLRFVPVDDPTTAARMHRERLASAERSACSEPVNTAILANLGRIGVPLGFVGMAADIAERKAKRPQTLALWQVAAHELASGQLWFSRADAHSRAFHNLASLPRELRPLLTLAGESIAEVDIANAQPFFLLSLYPESSPERRLFEMTVQGGLFYEALFSALPWGAVTPRQRECWGSDVADWKTRPELRDAFKEDAVAYCLYSERLGAKGDAASRHPINRALSVRFPELAGILALRLSVKGGASCLARELQGREAVLVLGRVFPRILKERPECVPVSLHDAVLCQRRFASAVAQIMAEETSAAYGVTPTVRVKTSALRIPTAAVEGAFV